MLRLAHCFALSVLGFKTSELCLHATAEALGCFQGRAKGQGRGNRSGQEARAQRLGRYSACVALRSSLLPGFRKRLAWFCPHIAYMGPVDGGGRIH